MYSPSNQIQSPDDEEDEEEDQPEDGDNSMSKDSAIKEAAVQETFLSYYNHHFVRTQDLTLGTLVAHDQQCPDFVSSVAVSTPSPKMGAKKRKSPAINVHGGGGGRCCAVQHSVRKDRHSKVRTARGPRDRRVRLSPTTAIQFYDVQDRLGYDRPSKAIDWLIKEAKAAIDALNEHPNAAENHRLPISKHGGFFISESDDPVSGFGFSVDAAASSSPPEFQAYMDQDFNASRNGSEASEDVIFYPSYQQEFLDLQKMFWNFGNENSGNPRGGGGRRGAEYPPLDSPPHLSPAPPISGDRPMFSHREPLQSSFITCSPINGNFPAFDFVNELSNITACASLKEDETNKKLVLSRPFSSDPVLHYQD